ncbi:uncharacterized protein SPAPADRAFT_63284 [Spathaspora passalidarum NRRL Y-27907]|uniref:Signal recognition particle subunit SRP72 n=1 Tax=Spathaspora passalidarum (strain NRRL Y-27907 / 11-Y1) TaxID=619300 RepID=G3AU73_SPAPN|nr:uncharacterized protein SPAPADRAFT_63284 [Spathaspora passalidarum NRRL Y-27907]EGW30449.1 hypothetical protein SPAPADRAFT_63284 [Spathaspora passalidarum NRRL Y-27907]
MSNSIADAFKKLHVSPDASPSEHEQIFTISYEYLTKVKNYQDLKAFKNCLVALINLDKYHKAYEIIKHVSKDLVGATKMEVGYVYYKLGHANELFELYKDNTTDSEVEQIGWNHILAQTYYKVGKYEQAYELYEKLLDSNKFDNPLDLIINQAAVVSQENILGAGRSVNIDKDDNYDLLFNQALVELSNNNLSKSLQLLDQAHNLCSSNTEWSKQDLLGELLPIKLTIAYVYQLLGDSEKSLTILDEINQDVDLVNDAMIKLIIKNNLYSLKDDYKVGLVERSLDYQPHLQKLQQKLTKWQYQIVLKNNIMLNYTSGTLSKSQVDNLFIKRYLEDFPGDFFPVAYRILLKLDISFKDLHSSAQLKSIGKKLVKYIKDAEAHYKQVAVLLLVYVHARTSKFDQPLPFLEALVDDELSEEKLTPGVVGTLINVYEETHSTSKLSQLLTKLTDKFIATSQEVYSDMFYFDCAKFIAFKALNQGQHEQAMKLFQYLSTIDGNDHLIESILSNSNVDLLPITELSSSKPIDEILNVDINELIPTKNQTKTITKTVNKVTKKKKEPKFGPSKVLKPEGEFTVDEERWLPLKLRSYYKPTKKDKKRNTGQGSVEHSVSSSTPAATHSSSSNKKKKKKGKK